MVGFGGADSFYSALLVVAARKSEANFMTESTRRGESICTICAALAAL